MLEIVISIVASGLITWKVSRFYYRSQIEQQNKETKEMKKILAEIHDSIKENNTINANIFNRIIDESSVSDEFEEYKILELEESGKYMDITVDPDTYNKYFREKTEKCKSCGENEFRLIHKEVPYIECDNCKTSFIYKDPQKQKYIDRYRSKNRNCEGFGFLDLD